MSLHLDAEHDLLTLLAEPQPGSDAPNLHLEQLACWQTELLAALQRGQPGDAGLRGVAPLAPEIAGISDWLQRAPAAWQQQWSLLQPARELAAHFPDACILLVFGKFNAGKSSLCNFLAQRLSPQAGARIRGFQLHEGRVIASDAALAEGAMETTAAVQGVVLADGLVLIDTPGLHSSTLENAALTLRFTDCADGMLWLSSSTAPGQVQELDELVHELRRGKPLQPVLTRSDVYEEDEVDGELVRLLRNKSADNRQLQEADVAERARERLRALDVDARLLRAPVSVSIHAARTLGDAPARLAEAGIDRLYAALSALAAPALAYRARKPAAVLLHHCEETMLAGLQGQLLPLLQRLQAQLQQTRSTLDADVDLAVTHSWRAVMLQIGAIVDQAVPGNDIAAAVARTDQVLVEAFAHHLTPMLTGFVPDLPALDVALQLPADAMAGTTAAAAGSHHEQLHRAIEDAARSKLDLLRGELKQQADTTLDRIETDLRTLELLIEQFDMRLQLIRRELLPDPAH